MSGKFGGFSQEDINKISTSSKINKENVKTPALRPVLKKTLPPKVSAGPKPSNQPKVNQQPAPSSDVQLPNISLSTTSDSSGSNSLLDALHFKPLPAATYDSESAAVVAVDAASSADVRSSGVAPASGSARSGLSDGGVADLLVQTMKGVSLRDYETQRRMVEEQNKHKQAMLYKVIEQHSERTAAEAKKLSGIKQELAKLESDLAVDVAILRKQIDAASLRYMKAHDHYAQVEGTFLKAKLDLQKARETQDLLAEHLNIIIVNNEDRKANKLADLMAKVGLGRNGETMVDAFVQRENQTNITSDQSTIGAHYASIESA